ncbi:MAG: 2Fe-2S iron-sulfur cluster binding domain-containing protein [Clostridiales bacterium]|nr:2Fe-2S iron-sulfur cluster binding domain-containing protein [Clostridiales bacterium]MBQ3107964.1 iron hydrogenase small subunit [Bacillota bacterium]
MAEKQYVTVDGIPVEINGEKNLLELIAKVGIKLPTFCYHSDLSIYGACRMCMVENERGGLDAACSTPPRGGMVIKTNTERLRRYRKNILELILANHCGNCTTCENNSKCKLQDLAMRFNITGVRFPNNALDKAATPEGHSSVSITRDMGKCILCGDCVRMCNEIQNVGAIDFAFRGSKMVISTAFGKPLSESPCVGCGQCAAVCPTGAIIVKNDIDKVWNAIDNPKLKTTVQIAPAVRVALGRELGLKEGENSMGKIVAALRRIGFDEIYDTSLSADLTVIEETEEFISRVEKGENLPLITSCCPGWIQYAENKHPEFLPNISTCRSPMQMFASILKEQGKRSSRKMFHVAVMPCTAKKYEAGRDEFKMDGEPNVDAVITTQELIGMIKESGIMFDELEPEAVDMPFGTISGAGVIFGVTGGVTEAVLRRVASNKSRSGLLTLANCGQRGMEGIKEFTLPYGDLNLHIAVVSGLANAEAVLKRVAAGEEFHFIEIMACPGGCVSGGGQPYAKEAQKADRSKGLYESDRLLSIRRSEENPDIPKLYEDILKGKVHELLHVHYAK